MHPSVMDFLRMNLSPAEIAGKSVLEVGSYDVNGSPRRVILPMSPSLYVGVDFMKGPGVDRVLPASDLVKEFGRESFDVVISTEMLEHAQDWRLAVLQMKDVLRPGGLMVVTTRGPGFPYHGYPHDYWRFTMSCFAQIWRDFDVKTLLPDIKEFPGVLLKAVKPDPFTFADISWIEPDKVSPLMLAYTALYGGRDAYAEPSIPCPSFVFTDEPMLPQRAQKLSGPFWIHDPVRRARCVKLLPHLWLPPHDVSIWTDASFAWSSKVDLEALVSTYLKDADMAVFRHYSRDCLYAEADVCVSMDLDDPSLISKQIVGYAAEGFPPHAGLHLTGVTLRRNTPECNRFCNAWWSELSNYSRRDQLSLPVLMRRLGFKVNIIDRRFEELGFLQRPHLA